MNVRLFFAVATAAALWLLSPCSQAETRVVAEHSSTAASFTFKTVPPPANNDAASEAQFTLIDGQRDPNGAELAALHDGRVPTEEDQPSENFFFRVGTDGGRIQVDLGRVISIRQVSTYSWHGSTRAPQVYKLYGADAAAAGLNPTPKRPINPESCGWTQIASVDTRVENGETGGQHGVLIADRAASGLGAFRYLLLDIVPTEHLDGFGNTFYSEIDVIDANGPVPTTLTTAELKPILDSFDADAGKYHFTIDATAAPDLMDWALTELKPVVAQWYPKLVALLPSAGFQAPTNVTLRFRNDMGGTPASAGGAGINLNSGWFRKELKREARGSVVHEMVHVIQSYGRGRRDNPNATRTPGWLVEGMADYIRWFLYEPETKGAEITQRNLPRAKYDASYRITANFLNWVTQTYESSLVPKLNVAARQGRYSEELWKEFTGKTVQQLGEEWLKANQARLENAQSEPNKP